MVGAGLVAVAALAAGVFLSGQSESDSGLVQVERILPGIEGISFCYLTEADVVRHRLVREIIKAYAEDQNG